MFWTWRSWADGPFVLNTRPLSPTHDGCARHRNGVRQARRQAAREGVRQGKLPRGVHVVHTARVITPRMSESDLRRVDDGAPAGDSVVLILTLATADQRCAYAHCFRLRGGSAARRGGAGDADTTLRQRRAHVSIAFSP
jgi:hypothetical protein